MPSGEIRLDLDIETEAYLPDAGFLHHQQVAGGFLASLGGWFLLEISQNIARSRHGVALVGLREREAGRPEVVGFLFGAISTAGLYRRFILRHALKACLFSAGRLIRTGTIRKVWETLQYPSNKMGFEVPEAELLDLAGADAEKGSGLAQEFLSGCSRIMVRRGSERSRIPPRSSLTWVLRLFERLGALGSGTGAPHCGASTRVVQYSPKVQADRQPGADFP